MRILIVIGLLAALAAPADAGTALPGTRLVFGQADSVVRAWALQPGQADDAAGHRVFAGPMRFFGLPSQGTLYFDSLGLARARFVVEGASPHTQAYVEDQLRRMAYRRSCQRLEALVRHCTWAGGTRLELQIEGGTMRARIEPSPAAAAVAAAHSDRHTALADAVLPDTLSLTATSDGRPPPRLVQAPPPIYPESARRASVQGVVIVLAQVDTAGRVRSVGLVRGVPELNDAALATVERYQFAPYRDDRGRAVGFWVEVPVRFILWPDGRSPGR